MGGPPPSGPPPSVNGAEGALLVEVQGENGAYYHAHLRDVFPDHEKIEALGLGAAINIPVFVCGKMLGTVNLLDVNNRYSSATVDRLQAFSVCATLAFLSHLQVGETA